MTPLLAGAQLALLTALLFAIVGSTVTSLAARPILASVAALPPGVAATRLRWVIAAPLLGSAAMTLLAFTPSLAASLAGEAHHCVSHEGHPHLCVVHLPGEAPLVGWLLLGLALVTIAWRLVPLARELRRAARLVAALPARDSAQGLLLAIDARAPICAAVGLLRPRVVVSEAFAAGVGEEGLRAAIAHETAHAARRDALWMLLARVFAVTLPVGVARSMLAALDLATERACDEIAAVNVGDRLAVAEAILRSHRLGLRPADVAAASFGPGNWSRRVEALLSPLAKAPSGWQRWDRPALAFGALAIGLAGELHHAAETALALLGH